MVYTVHRESKKETLFHSIPFICSKKQDMVYTDKTVELDTQGTLTY